MQDYIEFIIKNLKKGLMKFITELLKSKLFLLITLVIIGITVILPLAVYFITIKDGTYREDDWTSTPYVASTYTNSENITIDNNGLNTGSTAEQLWEEMKKKGNNVEDYLDTYEELEKLMNAEIITQYPKIGAQDGELDGIIQFQRHKSDGSDVMLSYISLDTFNDYIDNGNINAVNYFTIDNSGNLLIAVVNKTTEQLSLDDSNLAIEEYTENIDQSNRTNDGSYSKVEYTVTSQTINYKNMVQGFTMPFQYLWALLVISEDKDFVLDLADLVYDSEIIISIYDNITTTVNEDVNNYQKETRTKIYAKVEPDQDYRVYDYPAEKTYDPDYTTDNNTYTVTHTVTYENDVPIVDLTKADVWIVDYSKEYEYQANEQTSSDSQTNSLDDEEYNEDNAYTITSNEDSTLLSNEHALELKEQCRTYIQNKLDSRANSSSSTNSSSSRASNTTRTTTSQNTQTGNSFSSSTSNNTDKQASTPSVSVSVTYVECEYNNRKINRNETITSTLSAQGYEAQTPVNNPKVEKDEEQINFVTLLCSPENLRAKSIILKIPSWLFEILETNEDTANMVDLTRYLLNKVTDSEHFGKYDKLNVDFDSLYSQSDFCSISTSGTDALREYIRYFEHYTPPPTNADGTKYIIEDDGAGHPTVGYGVDIYNGGNLALFVAAGYPTTIGGEVDKEFVDALEEQEIQQKMNGIKSAVQGLNLKEYQIHALVSRAYNCGTGTLNASDKPGAIGIRNGKNFVQAYNAYWDEERDDLFTEQNNNANFSHSLYTQYMAKPVTSDGNYMRGLEIRRKSEWRLFQTGYYDVLNKWYVEGSGEGGSIIAIADEIHKYMENNKYTYCVYGGNSYEECGRYGKSHGLNKTFEQSKSGHHNTCCATYVSWVLQEAGYLEDSEHLDGATALQGLLIRKGWQKITKVSELQPGDVLCYNSHVEFYAGDGKIYNAGSGSAIRNASPARGTRINNMNFALRAPN